jgi:hypothetical protein
MIDDRQVRLLVILSAAVFAVGLVYAFRPEPETESRWDQQATETLWKIDADQVVYLQIDLGERGSVVARRSGDELWMLEQPLVAVADQLRMRGALSDLTSLELGIPVVDADVKVLGLGEQPRAVVTLQTNTGAEYTLRVGDPAPIGWATFVQREDGLVMVVPRHLDDSLMEDPFLFRDHNVFRYKPGDVVSGEIVSERGTVRVHKGDGGEWWLDGYGRADYSGLDMLFLGLLELRFDQILDGASPDGIPDPRFAVKITTADGLVHELRVGSELPNGGTFVQAASGIQGIIDPERMRILGMGPRDLGDSYAFPVRREGVDRMDIALGDLTASLLGGEGRWTWAGHSDEQAMALAKELRNLPITFRVGEQIPDPGDFTGRVTLGAGDSRLYIVDLGQQVQPGFTGARDISGGEPYLIATERLDAVRALLAAQ